MSFVAWLGTVAAVVGSVGIIWRGLIRPIIKWAIRLDKTMAFVEAQMVPNGGTTLRDSVNRIEARLVQVEELITQPK